MARASFSLPTLARCERPRGASLRASSFQPGRLAQGPEEKLGFAGRVAGAASLVIYFLSSQIARSSVGRSGPLLELSEEPAWRKAKSGEEENKRGATCDRASITGGLPASTRLRSAVRRGSRAWRSRRRLPEGR